MRTVVNQPFSVPKCVRLARMSEKSYELLCKTFAAVPERTKNQLELILGRKFMGYAGGNFSDFEKQNLKGSAATDYNAVDDSDEIHRVMMEIEPLLEASRCRNWRSFGATVCCRHGGIERVLIWCWSGTLESCSPWVHQTHHRE